jgi:hypothetical protein
MKTSLYANIDWEKASKLFESIPLSKQKEARFSAKQILFMLAKAADQGIAFLAHADNPAAAEYLLYGTGPLSWRTRLTIQRFKKQKYVTIQENAQGTIIVKIAKQGRRRALSYALDTMKLQPSGLWDGKWRVVIFDIPNIYKCLRDLFRMRLRQLDLYQLQESVYVSPYTCFDEVEFLRELYGVAFTVRYLLVESIEDDVGLREHFHLSS